MNPIKKFMASSKRVYFAIFVFSVLILVVNLASLLVELVRERTREKILNLEYRISIVEQAQQSRLPTTQQLNKKSSFESSVE